MAKYIAKRICLMLLTFFIIMSICFILIRLLPNPIIAAPGSDKAFIEMEIRKAWGLDKPIIIQYGIFLKNIFTKWDWGVCLRYTWNKPVMEIISQKLPVTMIINFYSLIFSVPIGIAFGVYAALKKNKWQDQVISTGVMIFVSVPSYVYAFLLQYFVGFKLGWFPLQLAPGTNYFSLTMLVSMVMPIMALSFGTIAGLTRFTRAELTEVLTSEFMLLARTKGLTKTQATVRHAFRNSLVPILPMIIGQFVGIMSGSLIIEKIFAIPGIGDVYIAAYTVRDYDLFLAISMFYTIIGLAAGLLVDLSYGFVDPRIRIGGKK